MKKRLIVKFIVFAVVFTTGSYSFAQNNVKVGGSLKTQFSYQPSDNKDQSEISVINARVKVTGDIDEKTSFNVMFETVRDDVLLDAFITRKIVSGLSLAIGQYKTPYSTDNLIGDTKYGFVNRPYMRDDAAPAYRDKGVSMTYEMKKFSATAAMMNGSGLNKAETNADKSMALRFVAKAIPHLNLSGNYYTGKNNTNDNKRDNIMNFGVDGIFGSLEYSAEFARKEHDEIEGNAYFAWVSYDIKTDMKCIKILTPAFRAERSDKDTEIDDNARSRYTIGLSAHFDKKFADTVIINYEVIEIEKGEADDLLGVQYNVAF